MSIMKDMSVDFARRRFMWKAGTALAAPVTVAVPWARAAAASDESALQARVALFEDQNAIRAATRAYVRYTELFRWPLYFAALMLFAELMLAARRGPLP